VYVLATIWQDIDSIPLQDTPRPQCLQLKNMLLCFEIFNMPYLCAYVPSELLCLPLTIWAYIFFYTDVTNHEHSSQLPGRTDNEIKNYWNTRKKRCERASLPIYPAGVRNQSSNEDQQLSGDLNGGENMSNDLLSGNSLCLPDFNNDSFRAKLKALPPQLPAVSISNLLGQSFASKGCSFMDQVDQAGMLKQSGSALPTLSDAIDDVISSVDQFSNDSEKLMQTLGFGYLNEANATSKSIAPFGVALTGSHAPLNGIFSASRLTNGPSKMEPPSVQNSRLKYTVDPAMQPTELVDPYMQSLSATPSVKSECASPRNSGLFEELLHEPHALRSGKSQQPSVRSSSSSAGTPYGTMVSSEFDMGQEYWEEQPGSLLSEYAHFSGNYLAECAPPVSAASTDIFPLPKISPGEYIFIADPFFQ
jgi:transcription factor MYB, plant